MQQIVTYNVQRDHSGNVVSAVESLARHLPNALICLQEVTDDIGRKIATTLPKSVHHDENMVIIPPDVDVHYHQTLYFGCRTRSFLHMEVSTKDQTPISLVTGKLRHGISFLERYTTLRDIFALFSQVPSLIALDTNHLLPAESRLVLKRLQSYGFYHTHHPTGTHDMRRAEQPFWRMMLAFCPRRDLDKIFFSPHLLPQSSHVCSHIDASDHEPVVAEATFR